MPTRENTSSRLVSLRSDWHLSQHDFAEKIGITQGALSQLESGKSALSIQTIRKICQIFNVDCNWLVLGRSGGSDAGNDEKNRMRNDLKTQYLIKDSVGQLLIPLIKEEAHAGYISNSQDSDYIETLDVYRIPGFESGNYRLFEIEGDSMFPTIHPREITVTEYVEDWDSIENGTICVVIAEEGIVAKRLYRYEEDTQSFILKSDNPDYKTYTLKKEAVIEIWVIKAKITSMLTQSGQIDSSRLKLLESDLLELKKKVKEISAGQGT